MSDKIDRQKGIDEVAQLVSTQLLETWLIMDKMLPERLAPIRDGLKRQRKQSSQGTALTTNFMMFLCTAGVLDRNGSMTMGELSRATAIPQSTTTRMADWMVSSGYVERLADNNDRRVVRVRLMDAGLELLLAAKAQLRELAVEFLERIPAVQRAALVLSLTDLLSAWQSVIDSESSTTYFPAKYRLPSGPSVDSP